MATSCSVKRTAVKTFHTEARAKIPKPDIVDIILMKLA
jgi:hypothetical protein